MEASERRMSVLTVLLWTHVATLGAITILLAFEGGIVLPMVLEQVGYFIGMGLGDGGSGPDGYAIFFHFLALLTASFALYAFQRGEPWVRLSAYAALAGGIFTAPVGLVVPAFLVHMVRRPDFRETWEAAPALQPKAARRVAGTWSAATLVLGILAAFSFFGFVAGSGVLALFAFLAAPGAQVGALFLLQRVPPKRPKKRSDDASPLPRLPDVARIR